LAERLLNINIIRKVSCIKKLQEPFSTYNVNTSYVFKLDTFAVVIT